MRLCKKPKGLLFLVKKSLSEGQRGSVCCRIPHFSQRSFTLIELMVVIIIVGVLASLAIPNLTSVREKSLDKEATAALRLILVAERQYRLSTNNYWPSSATTNSDINQINGNLSLVLASSNWAYRVRGVAGGGSFTANASRQIRNWTITNAATTPTCSGTCY